MFQSSLWTVESLTEACSSPASAKGFKQAINTVCSSNAGIDVKHIWHAEYHFDGESFLKGRNLIKNGVVAVKAAAKEKNYETARERLGEILHTLQVCNTKNILQLLYTVSVNNSHGTDVIMQQSNSLF